MSKFVYVISDGRGLKVGFSKNPTKRLKQLQTGNPAKLELLYSVEYDTCPIHIIEEIAHKQLSQKIKGEWYMDNLNSIKNVLDYIKIRYDNEETEIQYKMKILNYFN